MVKVYTNEYEPSSQDFEKKMREIELKYNYPLDHFQKYGIDGIYHDKNVLVTAHTGSGKCLGYNTPVMMYNGDIKKVQDIEIGDMIMGDDSTPRNVLSTTVGKEEMYCITLENGEVFTCNKSHILCLHYIHKPEIYNENNRFIIKGFCPEEKDIIRSEIGYETSEYLYCNKQAYTLYNYLMESTYFTMSIKDFFELPKSIQHDCVMYKRRVKFEEKYTVIEPYVFGYLLLQDTVDEIYIPYREVLHNLILKLEKYNCYLEKRYDFYYAIRTYEKNNRFMNELERIQLFQRIQQDTYPIIPDDYKKNSNAFLTMMVAGMIDAGTKHNNLYYNITVSSHNLAQDINYILNCVGLRNRIQTYLKSSYTNLNHVISHKYYTLYVKVSKYTMVPYLSCVERRTHTPCSVKNVCMNLDNDSEDEDMDDSVNTELEYTFTLESIGVDTYYGFTLDKNHQFLLGNCLVSHNTMVGEYAIQHYCNPVKQKKVIYTSPIKSLSNQKFHEFTEKFKDVSVGLLTGDIKFNPEAQCLIMTTEILRNYILSYNNKEHYELDFDIDIYSELGCVIFDEVHYINDKDRGRVWEEVMLSLPHQVQFVMLSATISNVETFGAWLEDIRQRELWVLSTNHRVVPLHHYGYYILPEKTVKELSKLKLQNHVDYGTTYSSIERNQLVPLVSQQSFNTKYPLTLHKIKNTLEYPPFVHPKYVLNNVVTKLRSMDLLPAICFVFSRKNVEKYASYMEHNLLEEVDTNIEKVVERESIHILKSKIPNYKEYTQLSEYRTLIRLISNGIAIHHSGILPLFKEMVEIMFMKGYVKLLFATETFAVGINLPTKCVLFTSLHKFNGVKFRYLHSHEYIQMAGRAGRRGIDTQGTIIHLNNMFEVPYTHEYMEMMSATPQRLQSKFVVHPNLLLKYVDSHPLCDCDTIVKDVLDKSMLMREVNEEVKSVERTYEEVREKIEKHKYHLEYLMISIEDMSEYMELEKKVKHCSKKQKKQYQQRMNAIRQTKAFKQEYKEYLCYKRLEDEERRLKESLDEMTAFSDVVLRKQITFLKTYGYIKLEEQSITITKKGILCSFLQEINGVVLSSILVEMEEGRIPYLETMEEWVCYLSCYIPLRVEGEKSERATSLAYYEGTPMESLLSYTEEHMLELYNAHLTTTGFEASNESEYELQYDFMNCIREWCKAETEEACLQLLEQEIIPKGVFLGEFTKYILKLVNICKEMDRVWDVLHNVKLKNLFSKIPDILLKHVIQNVSLYV